MSKLFIVALSIAILAGVSVAGQSKRTPLQGAWQAVEVRFTGPGAHTIMIPEPRTNLIVLSGKYYSRIEINAERPRPASTDMSKASADELRAIWGPFTGEGGTYEVAEGNVLTMRPLVAKNPTTMAPGAFVTYSYKIDGDTLWVTYQKNQHGPIVNPVTIKAVRVE